jgi:hypothetical protein
MARLTDAQIAAKVISAGMEAVQTHPHEGLNALILFSKRLSEANLCIEQRRVDTDKTV